MYCSRIFRLLSLIEGYPIRPVFIARSHLALWMKHHYLPILVTIPGVVPASAHVQIEGMSHLIATQVLYESLVGHRLLRFDDAQPSVLFAQSPVDVLVVPNLCNTMLV